MVPMPGPAIRTDIVDVYVFRGDRTRSLEFLQLRRAATAMLPGTWQPVMGHVRDDETASQCARRELAEETGFGGDEVLGWWQLESPNAYFLHARDCMMLSPCFAVRVGPRAEPALNHEHDASRWVCRDAADRAFLWPGQRQAITQIVRDIVEPGSPAEPYLRLPR